MKLTELERNIINDIVEKMEDIILRVKEFMETCVEEDDVEIESD